MRTDTRRLQIVNAIDRFRKRNGYSPNLSELCDECGLKSKSSIHHHITALREEGYVDWTDGISRSLHVVKKELKRPQRGRICPSCGQRKSIKRATGFCHECSDESDVFSGAMTFEEALKRRWSRELQKDRYLA